MYHFDGCVRFRVCDWICVRTMSTMAESSATLFTISFDYTSYKLQAMGRATHMHSFVIVVISEQSEQTVFNATLQFIQYGDEDKQIDFFCFFFLSLHLLSVVTSDASRHHINLTSLVLETN